MTIQKDITYILNAEEQDHIGNARTICQKIVDHFENLYDVVGYELVERLKTTVNGLDDILGYDESKFSVESED